MYINRYSRVSFAVNGVLPHTGVSNDEINSKGYSYASIQLLCYNFWKFTQKLSIDKTVGLVLRKKKCVKIGLVYSSVE